MSYTVVDPSRKPRPGVVSAACALLYVAAATQIVALALSATSLGAVRQVIDEELASTPDADALGTAITVGIYVAIAISALFAIGTVVLGVLVGKGKNPARIVTWVFAGIGVLCYGCSLAGTAVSGAMSGSFGEANADSAELESRIQNAIPAWQQMADTAMTIILLVALLAVIVLLMLPAANLYFRKSEQVWVPPTAYPDPGGNLQIPPTQIPPAPPGPPTS